jgi:hypothetical protein
VNPGIRAEGYASVVESCFTCDLEAGLARAEAGEAFALPPERPNTFIGKSSSASGVGHVFEDPSSVAPCGLMRAPASPNLAYDQTQRAVTA